VFYTNIDAIQAMSREWQQRAQRSRSVENARKASRFLRSGHPGSPSGAVAACDGVVSRDPWALILSGLR
jgi:hypothetical protein